jgi:hypothetical protein
MHLADIASSDGAEIWRKKTRLAAELNCSKPTLLKGIKEFIDEGLLAETGKLQTRRGHVVIYALNLAAISALPMARWPDDEGPTEFTGQVALPVKSVAARGKAALPKPSLNHSEDKSSGSRAPPLIKDVFAEGVQLLCDHGVREREARSLIGKWRQQRGDAEVLDALAECRMKGISSPVQWLTKRLEPRPVESFRGRYGSTAGRGSLPDPTIADRADPAQAKAILEATTRILSVGGHHAAQ